MYWKSQNIFSWPFIFSWWSRSYQRTFTISGERKLNFGSVREMSIYGKYKNTKEWRQKYRELALFQEIKKWILALWEKCQYMAAGKCKAGLVKEIFIYLNGFQCIGPNITRDKTFPEQIFFIDERLWKLKYIQKAGILWIFTFTHTWRHFLGGCNRGCGKIFAFRWMFQCVS